MSNKSIKGPNLISLFYFKKGRLKDDTYWYRYIYPKNLNLFCREKLVAPEISQGGNFSYDQKGEFYSTTKIYGYLKNDAVKESYLFWLGLLNSTLFWYFIQQTGYVLRGGYFTFKTNYILPFPIPEAIPESLCKAVEDAVNAIMKKREVSNEVDISQEEEEINNYVYELYMINEEERKIIENK